MKFSLCSLFWPLEVSQKWTTLWMGVNRNPVDLLLRPHFIWGSCPNTSSNQFTSSSPEVYVLQFSTWWELQEVWVWGLLWGWVELSATPWKVCWWFVLTFELFIGLPFFMRAGGGGNFFLQFLGEKVDQRLQQVFHGRVMPIINVLVQPDMTYYSRVPNE